MTIMSAEKKTGLIHQFLLRQPLKTLFLASTGIAILLLTAVTVLGVRQYILYQHCEQVVNTSRQLLFQFSTIKEHINETLISRKKLQFKDILTEIEELETQIALIRDDILIPEEFKQGFITQIDLVALVVKLRSVQENINPPSSEQLSSLTALLRTMFGRVSQFHQGLSSYTHALLLGLHKALVGYLALIIFMVSTLLFLINRSVSIPILQLGQKVRSLCEKEQSLQKGQKKDLIVSVHEIINSVSTLSAKHLRLSKILSAIALYETLEKKSTLQTERWRDICSVFEANAEYCLVWIGAMVPDEELPQPVSASGCLAASERGFLDVLDHLLKYSTQDNGFCDSVSKVMQTRNEAVSRLSTSSVPESFRSLLPFTDDTFSSASFPITSGKEIMAIITLYNPGHHCFSGSEMTLLAYFFKHLIHEMTGAPPAALLAAPTDTFSTQTLSRIYRSSALGYLATGLAHELTNLSNGAINYTQALLDLADEQEQASESTPLLEKLLTEEKKISHLAVELQKFTHENREEKRQYTVEEIMHPILTLTQGQTKIEGIELQFKINSDLPLISQNGKEIQLVILSLLQNARTRVLAKYPAGRHEKKQILLTASLSPETTQKQIVITLQDRGTALQSTEPAQYPSSPLDPWSEVHQCKIFIESLGGELLLASGPDQKNTCTLLLPG
jgi:hypothetical protein